MDRRELEKYIAQQYGVEMDRPWAKYPNYGVYRHKSNRTWFAVVMDVPKEKLGLKGAGMLDVVNLKCEPAFIGSLLNEPGFFPAWHMNKSSWITVALDKSAAGETIRLLLDISYDLTARKSKNKPEKADR